MFKMNVSDNRAQEVETITEERLSEVAIFFKFNSFDLGVEMLFAAVRPDKGNDDQRHQGIQSV